MNRVRALAVVTGVVWTVVVALVGTQADSDPVGTHYDGANRVFTLALLLLVSFAALLRRSADARHRMGSTLLTAGAGLLLAGNVLEFWGVLFSDRHNDKTAARLGEDQIFWGSTAGWGLFVVGLLLFFAAVVALSRAAGLRRGLPMAVLAVLGIVSTALWAVSPLAAAAAGVVFGVWLILQSQTTARPEAALATT
jgi:hypothetical protein